MDYSIEFYSFLSITIVVLVGSITTYIFVKKNNKFDLSKKFKYIFLSISFLTILLTLFMHYVPIIIDPEPSLPIAISENSVKEGGFITKSGEYMRLTKYGMVILNPSIISRFFESGIWFGKLINPPFYYEILRPLGIRRNFPSNLIDISNPTPFLIVLWSFAFYYLYHKM